MYKEAIKKTLKYEGGYVNDKDDRGGETYRGVSRRYHPNWSGWKIVDEYKQMQPTQSSPLGAWWY